MPLKGQTLTKEQRELISVRTKQAMGKPEVRKRLLVSFTAERCRKISDFHKIDARRPERIATSISNLPLPRGQYKHCLICGVQFWVRPGRLETAKYCSNECRYKGRIGKPLGIDISRDKNPNWRGGYYRECDYCGGKYWVMPYRRKGSKFCSRSCAAKANCRFSCLNKDLEFQLKRQEASRRGHGTSEYRQKMGFLLRSRQRKGPNKVEKQLIELISAHELPFKYTGDGSLIIGGYCPDFANSDGKKQLIELFGHYWHKKDKMPWHYSELGRIMAYNSLGFKCLVIWEHELEDKEAVVKKIADFIRK